ncbi:hypothetical protein M0R45_008012 [Rubus argutus]|uniref:C2H2-type domain-containing protein n=1 Tax=Rubus argutus TaxID=59490 RepID=A0AAW1XZX7_RUBAR
MDIEHQETQSFQPLAVDQQQQPTKIRNPPEVLLQDRDRGVAQPSHVCDICHKGFYSGQALGGHKSMHFREAEAMAAVTTSTSHTVSCVVCGRNFPSKKSLFGHMRTHKGNQSPQQDYNRSSSSSTVSDVPVADDECDDEFILGLIQVRVLICPRLYLLVGLPPERGEGQALVPHPLILMKLLIIRVRNWLILGWIRVPKSNASFAIKRSQLPSFGRTHVKPYKLKIVSMDHGHGSEVNSEPHQVVNVYRCSVCSRNLLKLPSFGRARMTSHCKEVKNNDSCSADHVDNEPDQPQPQPHQVDVHRCYVCNKAFTSYHALGGHMSSHAKIKNNNGSDRDQSNSVDMSACAEDDNERRQQFYETVPHQCKTCNRTFPTVNLNEIPTMEDEEGIYAPNVLLQLN